MRPLLPAAACVLALAACGKADPGKPAAAASAASPAAGQPAAPAPAPSIGDGAPSVRAGLWEMTMNTDGGVKGTSKICVDPAVQGVGAAYGQRYAKQDCSVSEWTRTGDGVDFKSVCNAGGAHVESNGQVRGDVSSKYSVKVDVKTTRDGVTTTSRIETSATRVGDCPADMSPGDQTMTINGRTITIKPPPGA